MRKVRVGIWGFGAMGTGMANMILKKKGIEIVSVCSIDTSGQSMYDILGVPKGGREDIIIDGDYTKAFTEKSCDVVLVATDSFTKKVFDKIIYLLEKKINVISTAEQMAYPQANDPDLSKKMDKVAKENGVSVLGTGINPGFVLDLLVLALSGTCEEVNSIRAKRVNDLSPFGKAVMVEQGVGVTKEAFLKGVRENTIAGHVGFVESINMIADGLGWKLDKIEQTKEPIMTTVNRKSRYGEALAGNVAGCRQCGYGYVNGEVLVEMEHPQQIIPEAEGTKTGDYISIKGIPNIDLQINPEIPGGIGTYAMIVNSIPLIINARPGLKTMLDIPVPRAIMGDVRDQIEIELEEVKVEV